MAMKYLISWFERRKVRLRSTGMPRGGYLRYSSHLSAPVKRMVELRADTKIKSQTGFNRIVPLGENIVRVESEQAKLFRCRDGLSLVASAVQIGGDGKAGLGGGSADEIEYFLVAVQRLAGPVFGDFGEQAMLDRIPL